MNNFNLIAPFYELLKKVIFGNRLSEAERYFSGEIQPGDLVLIVGGGNGKFLNHVSSGCTVDYLEFSKGMISNAKKQGFGGTIKFIHADFLKYELDKKYDWVISSFFLDVFVEDNLNAASKKIYNLLNENGKLIVTDFYPTDQLKGKLLLKLMHVFFNVVSGLESNSLKNIPEFLNKAGFRAIKEKFWADKKIFSIIFSKDGNL